MKWFMLKTKEHRGLHAPIWGNNPRTLSGFQTRNWKHGRLSDNPQPWEWEFKERSPASALYVAESHLVGLIIKVHMEREPHSC